jgi:iron(III) transport system ATP-binding protein
MSVLELQSVNLAFDKQLVVKDVSIKLNDGEIACLLGPSGCGKTTLLRAIAGFKALDEGTIDFAGSILSSTSKTIPPEKRRVGMVFQDFALFPHLNIAENICFGIRRQSKKQKSNRLSELLSLISLSGSERKYPHELSGGQQQRVALARAIAPRPHLLLLDEPFSSMDVELRSSLAKEIRSILKHEKITAVMVTHDQNEAFSMADRIGVMNKGKLLQWDTAENLYHAPNNLFVSRFVGSSNFLKGIVVTEGEVDTALGRFSYKNQFQSEPQTMSEGQQVEVLVRPEYIQKCDGSGSQATLVSREFRGGYYLYSLSLESGEKVQALLPSLANFQLGETVKITLAADKVSIFKIA